MTIKVFILGRPGSGKTTAAQHIMDLAQTWGYEVKRKNDYDILYTLFREDQQCIGQHRFQATEHGGFDVLDFSVLDEVLKELEKVVLQDIAEAKKLDIVIIEFTRNNYRETLSNFSPEFLKNSYVFFLDSVLDVCIQRIHQRVTDPPKPDHHFISDYIMHTYYKESKNDWEYISNELRYQYGLSEDAVKMYYNMDTIAKLLESAADFIENILKKGNYAFRSEK